MQKWPRREMHLDMAKEHLDKAIIALDRFIISHDTADWETYKEEDKLHRKHWGIAEAMYMRRYGKILNL